MSNIALLQHMAKSHRIPNLPNQVRHLLQAFANQNLGLRELAKVIDDHPSIAVRLIALANSAWAAPATPVNSVERACLNLGLTLVRSVSIGLALITPFNVTSCPVFDLSRFWVSSKLVADGAVWLAAKLPNPPAYDAVQSLHTAGLLHHLGLLCLADLLPKETQQALKQYQSESELTLNSVLSQILGTDYCEVGGYFAEIWGLPEELVEVIRHHRNPSYEGLYFQHVALVEAAACMISALSRSRQTLPDLVNLDKLGIDQASQQQVFEALQQVLPETTEMAVTLFHFNR